MVAVPTSRGCDACRKTKKKCDQIAPTCSRCERLQIACIGSGKQRFIFKEQYQFPLSSKGRRQKKCSVKREAQECMRPICYSPSNDQSMLTSAFIDAVRISTDLRYSLSWAYGAFLAEVPRRIGTNKALDAASQALIASHLCFSSPGRVITPQALSEYARAITALRSSLDDSNEAHSVSTLCAVNILLIIQGLIGCTGKRSVSHCQGAADILKARGIRYNIHDDFERGLFLALRNPILFEGIFNEKIDFSPQQWEQLVQNDFDKSTDTGFMMQCLARVPDIVRRGRKGFKNEQFEELTGLRNEVHVLYDGLRNTVDQLRAHYLLATDQQSPFPLSPFVEISDEVFSRRLWAHWQRTYGLALTITLFFSCILRSLTFLPDESDALQLNVSGLVAETIAIAEDAMIFRPLGSSYIVLCLVAAWSCASSGETRIVIEELLEDYLSDFPRRQEQTELDLGIVARHFDIRHDYGSVDIRSISSGGYRIC